MRFLTIEFCNHLYLIITKSLNHEKFNVRFLTALVIYIRF